MNDDKQTPITALEKLLLKIGPWLLAFAALLILFVFFRLGKTTLAVKETSAYTRVSNCIVAKVANPPTSQDDVEKCYVQVEKQTGINLVRFDIQNNNENPIKVTK